MKILFSSLDDAKRKESKSGKFNNCNVLKLKEKLIENFFVNNN